MIEWGESALIALIIVSLGQLLMPLLMTKISQVLDSDNKNNLFLKISCFIQYFQFFLISFSFLSLIYAYVVTDLRVFNVVMNTHQEASLLYRITGVWGNHEGSMILWLWILLFYGTAVAIFSPCPARLKIYTLSMQSFFTFIFGLFVFFTSNPFLKAAVPYLTGRDLNPILQDPALAFHPPTLYLGFVGFSIVLSFALASLLQKEVNGGWIKWARPWALIAWSFLSVGIAMGSWWAYYELGWGGWWFWDPVENASLMPWLAGVALIHAFALVLKNQSGLKWAYCLSIFTFLLSLLGTFLVRSGALSSVHSFASDPQRGLFLLGILIMTAVFSVIILFRGFKKIDQPPQKHWSQRAGLIIINNYFVMALVSIVILGTLYPLILESITGTLMTVGPPYYSWTFAPFVLILLILMGLSYTTSWGPGVKKPINLWGPLSLTLSLLVILWWQHGKDVLSILMIGGAAWMILATLQHVIQKRSNASLSWPMILAHGGLALSILGMGLDTLGKQENLVGLKAGDSIEFQGYKITLKSLTQHDYPTYKAERASVQLEKGSHLSLLTPEKRYYASHETLTTETALYHTWLSNLYFALGGALPGERWTLRIYYHPWVELIWLGGLLMALGGFVASVPKIWQRRPWKNSLVGLIFMFSICEGQTVEIGERLIDPVLEQRARDISLNLKCPVCAGQSIDDSHAPMAKDLRRHVRENILEGKTDQEIYALMKAQYGESVLFEPTVNIENSVLWIIPLLAAFGGIAFIRSYFFKNRS
ncbi:MAG: cytochrome c-type biogenesis CcmF C-terminal domain-containing protein [Janthinobacterium lividum]